MRQPHCLFCSTKALSKEHIWPDWMVQLFKKHVPPRRDLYTGTFKADGRVTRTLKVASIEETSHLVCTKCNNEWMSDIENAAKPILSELIEHGMSVRRRVITAEDQLKIAVWLQLRSMILDALKETAADGSFYSISQRREFGGDRQEYWPLPNTYVWLAPYGGTPWSVDRHVINGGPKDVRIVHTAHTTTVIASRIALQLFTSTGEPALRPNFDVLRLGGWHEVTRLIWPCEGDISWPPKTYLSKRDVQLFKTRLAPDKVSISTVPPTEKQKRRR